jgi:hypothetical protein
MNHDDLLATLGDLRPAVLGRRRHPMRPPQRRASARWSHVVVGLSVAYFTEALRLALRLYGVL